MSLYPSCQPGSSVQHALPLFLSVCKALINGLPGGHTLHAIKGGQKNVNVAPLAATVLLRLLLYHDYSLKPFRISTLFINNEPRSTAPSHILHCCNIGGGDVLSAVHTSSHTQSHHVGIIHLVVQHGWHSCHHLLTDSFYIRQTGSTQTIRTKTLAVW